MTQATQLTIDASIGTRECLGLVASAGSGHLAAVNDGEVNIFPVAVHLDGDQLVVFLPDAAALEVVSMREVGLAVERVDPLTKDAWSIVVHGVAFDLTGAPDLAPQDGTLELGAWPLPQQSGPAAVLVPSRISGHRFSAASAPLMIEPVSCWRGNRSHKSHGNDLPLQHP